MSDYPKPDKEICIAVEQSDIDKSLEYIRNQKMNPSDDYDIYIYCPIALAAKRLLNTRIEVMEEIIYIDDILYLLNEDAQNFIKSFDKGLTTRPAKFTFTLSPEIQI